MASEAAGVPAVSGANLSPRQVLTTAAPLLILYVILACATLLTPERTGFWLGASVYLALTLALLSAIDGLTFRLPDVLTLPLIAAGLVATTFMGGDAGWHALSAIAGYGAVALVARAYRSWRGFDGLGLGDAKLFAAAGAWLGLEHLPLVMLSATLTALFAVLLEAVHTHRIDSRMRLAFGPYLAFGLWLVWVTPS